MSEYIIDPSWFYWASVLNTLRVTFYVISIVGLVVVVTGISVYVSEGGEFRDVAKKKWIWVLNGLFTILLVAAFFIPSKETMIQMMVAKFVTHDNLRYSVETIKEIADYIMEGIGK